MSTEEIKRQFAEHVKLRGYDDHRSPGEKSWNSQLTRV